MCVYIYMHCKQKLKQNAGAKLIIQNSSNLQFILYIYICVCTYICIYLYVHIYVCVHIYMYL